MEKLKKNLNLDDRPWYQSWEMALMYYMSTGVETFEFQCMDPKKIKIYKFKIMRKERVAININGKYVSSQKVRIRLTGLFALFFGVDCWVRTTDWLLLRMKNSSLEVILVGEKSY